MLCGPLGETAALVVKGVKSKVAGVIDHTIDWAL